MALRHAVLAALLDGDASGYELAQRFDASVANFWHARPQQIYGELRHIEQQGLIRGRNVRQRGRPNKRVFTITEGGRDALREFAAAPTRPGAVKEDLAVKVYAAAVADPEALIAALNHRAAQSAVNLERYQSQADALGDPDGADIGPSLTLARGIAYERENINWCALAAKRLRRRADNSREPSGDEIVARGGGGAVTHDQAAPQGRRDS
jgi:DNA-binding PadR family transcriptional regulator